MINSQSLNNLVILVSFLFLSLILSCSDNSDFFKKDEGTVYDITVKPKLKPIDPSKNSLQENTVENTNQKPDSIDSKDDINLDDASDSDLEYFMKVLEEGINSIEQIDNNNDNDNDNDENNYTADNNKEVNNNDKVINYEVIRGGGINNLVILANGKVIICTNKSERGQAIYKNPCIVKVNNKDLTNVTRIFASYGEVVALTQNGKVIMWEDKAAGEDASTAAAELTDVVKSSRLFTTTNGRVIVWGDKGFGEDSSKVVAELSDVTNIFYGRGGEFFALTKNGRVIMLTESEYYAKDFSKIAHKLTDIDSIVESNGAFAALKDGKVITWGDPCYGGDSSRVADELKDVTSIVATMGAFAALKKYKDENGNEKTKVITWGSVSSGGDPNYCRERVSNYTNTKEDLTGITSIVATMGAFAALKDGKVITWGSTDVGGDSSSVSSELSSGVVNIFSNYWSFAALKDDGSVVTWGDSDFGGDSSKVANELKDPSKKVTNIFSTYGAFAALREDGTVVTWGGKGGDSSNVADELTDVDSIVASKRAFAALKKYKDENGNEKTKVITWGSSSYGGDSSSVSEQLNSGVVKIVSSTEDFTALKSDGSVITWGCGKDSANIASELLANIDNIDSIVKTSEAFAALTKNGKVITWGYKYSGGDSSKVAAELKDVTSIIATDKAFAALTKNGKVITWGDEYSGGDPSFEDKNTAKAKEDLTGITSIVASKRAFAALKDGKVITWGNKDFGGDSSDVAEEISSGVKKVIVTHRTGSSLGVGFAAIKDDDEVKW